MEIILACPSCDQKNRVSDALKPGRLWKCAKCGNELLHMYSRPGERLLSRSIDELRQALEDLGNIKVGAFAGKRILKIETQIAAVQSRIAAWKEHLEFIAKPEERELAKKYHASDLLTIEVLDTTIRAKIAEKAWLRRFFEASQVARAMLTGLSDLLAIAGGVLTVLGLPNGLLGVAQRLNNYRITSEAS